MEWVLSFRALIAITPLQCGMSSDFKSIQALKQISVGYRAWNSLTQFYLYLFYDINLPAAGHVYLGISGINPQMTED